MSAETICYVAVKRLVTEWIEVQAVTLEEAEEKVKYLPDIAFILGSSYIKPTER